MRNYFFDQSFVIDTGNGGGDEEPTQPALLEGIINCRGESVARHYNLNIPFLLKENNINPKKFSAYFVRYL